MGKIRVGNKQNAIINGEYAKHVRDLKKFTSGVRRRIGRQIIYDELKSDYK